jgi:hypothetical protein
MAHDLLLGKTDDRDWSIGWSSGAATPAPTVRTNLAQAITDMQEDYAKLSKLFGDMRRIAQLTKKPIPRAAAESYNAAAKQHMAYANSVFAALEKNKLHIRQVVRRDGEPIVGPDGQVKTLSIDSPLQPPSFTLSGDEVGIVPLVIAAYIVGGMIVVGVTGYVTVKVLEKIQVLVQGRGYEPKKAEDFVSTFKTLLQAGVPPEKAAEQAERATKAPEPGPGTGWLMPAGLAAAAGVLAWVLFGRKAA